MESNTTIMKSDLQTYVAFLRGINVGGHHKVPMVELKSQLHKLGLKNIATLLNSGNIIFQSSDEDILGLEHRISTHLEKTFGFPIPIILRPSGTITDLLLHDPFALEEHTKDIRLFVSFLKKDNGSHIKLPYVHPDLSFTIIHKRDLTIFSILDLSKSKTPKAMEALERLFGKEITTRNWNTIQRIGKKLSTGDNWQ
ncbi:DUF1697 domain-containing protein [Sediminicola sp. 1XM1-17]|uniref:DUF1697 domain-containing protein n=1 Tax=Sediminicola sp. 1XM1-17 TaxID=3127702 RepID=UPI0030785872